MGVFSVPAEEGMFFDVHPENCFGVGGISIVHGREGSL